jgi:hypothetical protein
MNADWRTFKCRLNCRWSREVLFYHYFHLKVSKREIFITELFTLSDPIWVGDLGTEASIFFSDDFVVDKKILAHTKLSAKNI